MRLSPRSRPLQSNHSCNVCAPPPEPPPPMAMASRPSESGMLASVEARCTCAVLPSCASTARITFRMRASGPVRRPDGCRSRPLRTARRGRCVRRRRRVASRFSDFDGLIERDAQRALQAVDFGHRGGAQIDAHAGRLRNRVDGRAAANHADIECRLRRGRHRRLAEALNGAGEDNDRIGRAEVAPGVPARTAHNHFEAAAAERLGHDRVRSGAIDASRCRRWRLASAAFAKTWRMPRRSPSPSSPTLPMNTKGVAWRTRTERSTPAMASIAVIPAPLSETPGPYSGCPAAGCSAESPRETRCRCAR